MPDNQRKTQTPSTNPDDINGPPVEPMSFSEWSALWGKYRVDLKNWIKNKQIIKYGVGVRKDDGIGLLAGPFATVEQCLSGNGYKGHVIVELPSNRILYKWKDGKWFQKGKE